MRRLVVLLVLTCSAAVARADDRTQPTWQGLMVRAGFASTTGPLAASGPRIGLGYRVELPRLAFEVATEGERLAPDQVDGSWTHSAKAVVRAEYVHAFDDLAVRLGGGLGYGTERFWRNNDDYGYVFAQAYEEDGAHAELRAGLELGHGPITTIDVGVRLPLFRIEMPKPVYWPTVDVTLGFGVGSLPDGGHSPAAYRGSVVVADLLSAAVLWAGTIVWFGIVIDDCGDCSRPSETPPAIAALTGLVGYFFAAPIVHSNHHNRRGVAQSFGYRVGAAVLGGLLGALGGEAEVGVAGGVMFGAVVAPIVDYAIAAAAN